MRNFSILGCLMCVLGASGCDTVTVRHPIGLSAQANDLKMLEGTWVNDDGETIQIRQSKTGNLTWGVMQWDDVSSNFRVETGEIVLTRIDNFKLLHLKSDEDDELEGLGFVLYEYEDHKTIKLYLPLAPVFQQAVQTEELKGLVEKKFNCINVKLNATSDEVANFMLASNIKECFEQQPTVTFRLLKQLE